MEGYLNIKKIAFFKVWAVLEEQRLSYYADFDRKTQTRGTLKGVLFLRDAVIKAAPYGSLSYCIYIECSENGKRVSAVFDCTDPKLCSSWNKCLQEASQLHKTREEIERAPVRHRELLEIPTDVVLTKSILTKAYKKISLSAHPDRGGDAARFNEINVAYKSLLEVQEDEDMNKKSIVVDYEVLIEKGGSGVGLGLSITQNKVRNKVVITDVMHNIIVRGISEEAEGEIRIDDAIIGIDKEDVSSWPISRIRSRIENFRVPVGSTVLFLMERRVPKDEGICDPESPISSPVHSPTQTNNEGFAASGDGIFGNDEAHGFKSSSEAIVFLSSEVETLKSQLDIEIASNVRLHQQYAEVCALLEKSELRNAEFEMREANFTRREDEFAKLVGRARKESQAMMSELEKDGTYDVPNVKRTLLRILKYQSRALDCLNMSDEMFQKLLQEQETVDMLLERVHTIEISLMSMVDPPLNGHIIDGGEL